MTARLESPTIIDLNDTSDPPSHGLRLIPVSEFNIGRVQCSILTGTWTNGRLSVEQSLDGTTEWSAMDSDLQISAPGISAAIDLRGVNYVRVRCSTAQGSASTVRVAFYGENNGVSLGTA